MTRKKTSIVRATTDDAVFADVVALIDAGRRASVRTSNSIMTATYWGVGRRVVEEEQHGGARAEYGAELLTLRRSPGAVWTRVQPNNLFKMRSFYLGQREILSTRAAADARRRDPARGEDDRERVRVASVP